MKRFLLLATALLALPVLASVWEATRMGFQQWQLVDDNGVHISWHQSEAEAVEWGQKWSVANERRSFQTMHTGTRWDAVAAIVAVSRPERSYGHYFATRYGDTPANAAALCEETGVVGINYRSTWAEVEPTEGNYDFSEFDSVLTAIGNSTNTDCKLFLFVEFKSFPASDILDPCPAHLSAYSAANANGAGTANTCFMWEAVVVADYKAMLTALASHTFGGVALRDHANIEGYIFQESALGFNGEYSQDVADGGTYTAELFRDALIEMMQHSANTAFPAKSTVMFLNFIRNGQSYLYDVSTALAQIPGNRGCYSGPDLLPDETSLYSTINHTYEVMVRHDGCRSNSAQNNSYQVTGPGGGVNDICDDPDPDCTMAEIFEFGVSGTFGDFDDSDPFDSGTCINSYFFWNNRRTTSTTGLDWTDALPVIAANPYGSAWTDQCVGGGAPL